MFKLPEKVCISKKGVILKKNSGKKFGNLTSSNNIRTLPSTGDVIIYGNTKISLFQNRGVNLTISDNINYRSLSTVKLIHSLMFGIGFNIMN